MQLRHGLITFPQKHTCGEPECLRVFASNRELQQHAKLAKHKPYRCECGYLRSDKGLLTVHAVHANRLALKNIVHSRAAFKEPQTCAEEGCYRVFSNGNKLQEHAKVTGHKAFQCICSKSYSKLCSLGRHIDESRDDGDGRYKCPKCPLKWYPTEVLAFKRLSHLEQHLRARHRQTTEEAKAILLPFRKRKAGTSQSALAAGPAAKQDAVQEGSSPLLPLEPFVDNTAAARTAFLAVATGAVPPAHDTNVTALTDGPSEDLARLDAEPVDFNEGAVMENMPHEGDGLALQAPEWSDQLSFQTIHGTVPSAFDMNGLSSSHLAHGGASGALAYANLNSYTPTTPFGLATASMNNTAPLASLFNQSQVHGSMIQNNPLSLTPNFGTFVNSTQPSSYYCPPLNPVLGQSVSLNHGQMGSALFNTACSDLTTGQVPMGNMLGYHGTVTDNLANPTFAPVGFNTGVYTQPLTGFVGYDSLSEELTAADLYPQVFPGQAD